MSPELELLVCCACTHVNERRGERIRELTEGTLDWDRVLELAGKHGVRPLLYQTLRLRCWEAVSPNIQQQLEEQVQAVTHHNLRLTAELGRLLGLFKERGISPIALKGPAMAENVYGSIGLRESGDLDVLVKESEIEVSRGLLLAQEYEPNFHFTPTEEVAFLKQSCEFEFTRSGVLVEIHWRLAPSFHSFALDLRTEAISAELAGRPVWIPAPEELLVYLCHHGAKHLWFSLKWICDVAELLRRHPDLDWNRVLEKARGVGSARLLLLGLALAHDLMDAPVPTEVRHEDRVVSQVAAQLIASLENPAPPDTTSLPYYWTSVRLRERLRDRLRFCLVPITPTPGDWAQFRVPRSFWFLYYFARPFRLLRKFGLGALVVRSGNSPNSR